MPRLEVDLQKTLKLTNVLIYRAEHRDMTGVQDIDKHIVKMENYINVNGAKQIGPLIQYSYIKADDLGNFCMEMKAMLQCNRYIENVAMPYYMEEEIRVPNCIYCRYSGPNDKMKFAYDKIMLTAFEEDIPLKGNVYTVLLKQDEENDTVMADLFMERADS